MAHMVEIKCPTCGNTWQEDYDKLQVLRVEYRGERKKTRVEEYAFTCPRDNTQFIKMFEVEEKQ